MCPVPKAKNIFAFPPTIIVWFPTPMPYRQHQIEFNHLGGDPEVKLQQTEISSCFGKVRMRGTRTYLFHIFPITPVSGFWSAKLCFLAFAVASVLLRFWFMRPEKSPPLWEPYIHQPLAHLYFGWRKIEEAYSSILSFSSANWVASNTVCWCAGGSHATVDSWALLVGRLRCHCDSWCVVRRVDLI